MEKIMYKLTEIGFDTSYETEESLIRIAEEHCEAYRYYKDDRRYCYPKITTLEQAINYFLYNGFDVQYIPVK